jgi:hypothetical protein
MTDTQNFFTNPYGGGGHYHGGGDNAGLLAILAATGALGGRRDDRDCRDDCHGDHLNSAVDGINHNINTSTLGVLNQMNQGFDNIGQVALMSKLGSIEGAIPLVGSQVQLAVCEASAGTNAEVSRLALGAAQGFANVKDAVQANGVANLLATNAAERTTLTSAATLLAAIKDSQYATAIALRDDGDKTRAQSALYHEANLQRKLAVVEGALLEERANYRAKVSEVNVSQTVNQIQAQSQEQAQRQETALLVRSLCDRVNSLQNAVATNSNLIVGNTGGVLTGAQTSNPVNVRA